MFGLPAWMKIRRLDITLGNGRITVLGPRSLPVQELCKWLFGGRNRW